MNQLQVIKVSRQENQLGRATGCRSADYLPWLMICRHKPFRKLRMFNEPSNNCVSLIGGSGQLRTYPTD
jgi:hypothetical protein